MEKDDGSWRDLKTWERIAWARSRRFETATAAAESLGMKSGTYSAYERDPASSKHIRLEKVEMAKKFARKFRVRWQWLMLGEGRPFGDDEDAPVMRLVNALIPLPPERQEQIVQAVEALIKTGTDNS